VNLLKNKVRMSNPCRVWTVICCRCGEVWFVGLLTSEPFADQVLNHPVAEEKGEYTGQGKDPPDSAGSCFNTLSAVL